MRTIKIHSRLLVTVLCVLVSFIVPVTALAVDCPCLTAQEVKTYATQPEKFVCNIRGQDQGAARILARGEYFAYLSISTDDYEDLACSAGVLIGDFEEIWKGNEEPKVVLLDRYVAPGHMDSDEWYACRDLIELGDPPDCPCFEDCD